jgi:hypothetical protein
MTEWSLSQLPTTASFFHVEENEQEVGKNQKNSNLRKSRPEL